MSIQRRSKCFIKKGDFLCYTGFVEAVKLAKQIQLTLKMMVNLSLIVYIPKFLKTNLFFKEDFI